MAEGSDYESYHDTRHDFTAARNQFADHASTSFEKAKSKNTKADDLIPVSLTTKCAWPLLLFFDVTGSQDDWPRTIFSKAPYLEYEAREYMGKDLEACVAAIGDMYETGWGTSGDKYFVQFQQFTSGIDNIKKALMDLVLEGGGGGQAKENYEIAFLYALYNIHTPNATRKPLLIITADEGPYENVTREIAKKVHVDISSASITTDEIIRRLCERFSVYMMRKKYAEPHEHEIHRRWVKLLGSDHVCILKSAERAVDVMFGIMAKEAKRIGYFKRELEGRQTPEQCREAFEVLESIFDGESMEDVVDQTQIVEQVDEDEYAGIDAEPFIEEE